MFDKKTNCFKGIRKAVRIDYTENASIVKQPYDYPVGNVYYISIDAQYENAKTRQYFFIINGHKQFEIYEYKIEIL